MAENSAFWDGEVTGDAASATGWEARYSALEKSEILSLLFSSNDSIGYILPEYDNELTVSEATVPTMSIFVATGSALVAGRLYANLNTETLTIAANASGNPRIDRIILRTSFAAQTIRLAVLQGTPGATPALPALTQNANTWEVSLAYIWVADGASIIENENIHDERLFLLSFSAVNNSCGLNKIINSEFMALDSFIAQPANWIQSLTSTLEPDSAPSSMARGRSLKLTAAEISQTILVKPDTMYSIRGLIKVNTGDTASISAYTDSLGGGTTRADKIIYWVDTWLDYRIYIKTDPDSATLTFTVQTDGIAWCGQTLIVEGYHPGTFREISELLFPNGDPDSPFGFGYLSDSFSTETVVWDMDTSDADLVSYIFNGTKTILLASRVVRDNYYLDPTAYGVTYRAYNGSTILGGVTPSNISYSNSIVQLEIPIIERRFEADYVAIDTDTLNVEYIIQGMRT